jgi:hypothetical protein
MFDAVNYRAYGVADPAFGSSSTSSGTTVLYLLLYLGFGLYERKTEIQIK